MDAAAAAGRVSPHMPVDSAPINAIRCLSKCALITLVAIGAIVCVGLCFIPPIGLGVGLGVSIFAIVLLTSFLIGCCSSRAERVHVVTMDTMQTPPIVGGDLGSAHNVTIVHLGESQRPRHRSYLNGLYPERAPIGRMRAAGNPPPPDYDSSRFNLHQQAGRTVDPSWGGGDGFASGQIGARCIPGHRSPLGAPPPPGTDSSWQAPTVSAFRRQGNRDGAAPSWDGGISGSASFQSGARAIPEHRDLAGAPPPPGKV